MGGYYSAATTRCLLFSIKAIVQRVVYRPAALTRRPHWYTGEAQPLRIHKDRQAASVIGAPVACDIRPGVRVRIDNVVSIGFVGTDHTRAPLALRGRLAIDGERLDLLYELVRRDPLIAEAAVLSTCNRIEVYVAAPDIRAALGAATAHLLTVSDVGAVETAGCLEQHVDEEAVRHLLAVAAGLRSLVVGETQIGTQVREAFEDAARRAAAGAELQALARAAVQCGKRVRSETALGVADTSVSAIIVGLARRRLGGLHGRMALLIGAGRINEVSAHLLREAGIGDLVVVSRTRDAAARLATACDGRAAAMDDLPALLAAADLAVTATRAPEPPVTPAAILPRDPSRPLLLYDIAVPRDVDPAVGALPGVELTDLDGLRAAPRLEGARDGVDAAWRLVDACVERYAVEARARRAVPMIARLRAHVDSQKEAELARTLASLEHLAEADRAEVGMLAHRLVNRMFHHLATRLKAAAVAPEADTYLEALAFLFDETGTSAAHDERGTRHVSGRHDHTSDMGRTEQDSIAQV